MAASRIPNPLGQGSSPWGVAKLGFKVFMDARRLVTPKERDRYPLRPPLLAWVRREVIRLLYTESDDSSSLSPGTIWICNLKVK